MSKVIDKNEARIPFLGDRMSFVTGLDPLGLQNPSSQAYSYLLPGLNNVTTRIRFYSFYCWLLTEYAKQIKTADPKQQKKFIRKAEYIISLIAVETQTPSIPGSLYASRRFQENLAVFNLNTGTYNADGSTANTYWQYSSGILGQYYAGSLRQIGLIEEPMDERNEPMGIYRRTAKQARVKVSGEELALAFDESIAALNKQLFFHCMEEGSIDHSQLQQLAQDFNLAQFKPNSKEPELLLELLLDVDDPSVVKEVPECMRKQTLLHVLRYVFNHSTPIDRRVFTMYAYDIKGMYKEKADDCLMGWYYYQLNEYWQVACTAIFNGVLDYLRKIKEVGWMPLHELIKEATHATFDFLLKIGAVENKVLPIASVTLTDFGSEKELYEKLKAEREEARMTYGFLLIWKLYEQNKEYLVLLKEYTRSRAIGDNYDVLSFYLDYDKYLEQPTKSFMEIFLLNKIIYRHQKVAYRKMGSGSQSTQKFIIEDNYIRQIGNFDPAFTGPRVGNLISYLQDLNLLDDSKKLTEPGIQLLMQQDS